jgi:hypothetical protein
VVKVRRTTVMLPAEAGPQTPLHTVWEALIQDRDRIGVIVSDLLACVEGGRSPLVLADRKVYLERLQLALSARAPSIACLRLEGQMAKKARRDVLRRVSDSL